jgi:hypothetical protein
MKTEENYLFENKYEGWGMQPDGRALAHHGQGLEFDPQNQQKKNTNIYYELTYFSSKIAILSKTKTKNSMKKVVCFCIAFFGSTGV